MIEMNDILSLVYKTRGNVGPKALWALLEMAEMISADEYPRLPYALPGTDAWEASKAARVEWMRNRDSQGKLSFWHDRIGRVFLIPADGTAVDKGEWRKALIAYTGVALPLSQSIIAVPPRRGDGIWELVVG